MIRKYGQQPYRLAVVHGGPGDVGSLADVAAWLSQYGGVLEPIQSCYSLAALVDELTQALRAEAQLPIVLLGHSWGAWLSLLVAIAAPDLVKGLILVGCPPMAEQYVPLITSRRIANLPRREQEELKKLLALPPERLGGQLSRLGELVESSDNYSLFRSLDRHGLRLDSEMYLRVWPEAAARRKAGTLFTGLANVTCPLVVIHGEQDPHPLDGVIEPLQEQGLKVAVYCLERCGHTPFRERYAYQQCYQIIVELLTRWESAVT